MRKRHPNYKGGSTTSHGYRLVYVGKDHHLADVRGYAYKHRLVAEKKLGRRLRKGEVVHHKKAKLNNRQRNLEVKRNNGIHISEHLRVRTDLKPAVMQKSVSPLKLGKHEDIVIRRERAAETLRGQLTDAKGRPKFNDPNDRRVIYASPLVDVASNMELVAETVELCKVILSLTNWHIRLLSKSNLLPKVASALEQWSINESCLIPPRRHDAKNRIIYGVSTGTLDNKLAQAFEQGCPLVSKRIESLHWLQDNGFRTFGMICPSLPQENYCAWSAEITKAIRSEQCEHVWAEVVNLRGESFTRTVKALKDAGFNREAGELREVNLSPLAWESYARATFLAHATWVDGSKLRFLQYVNKDNFAWWKERESLGAVLLGNITHTDA